MEKFLTVIVAIFAFPFYVTYWLIKKFEDTFY